jgi:hypothetical protein
VFDFFPAIAAESPHDMSITAFPRSMKDNQAAESLPSYIFGKTLAGGFVT